MDGGDPVALGGRGATGGLDEGESGDLAARLLVAGKGGEEALGVEAGGEARREAEAGEGIPFDRILHDLHSGRFFGALGPWLMDVTGIALLWLVGTGLYNAWRRR